MLKAFFAGLKTAFEVNKNLLHPIPFRRYNNTIQYFISTRDTRELLVKLKKRLAKLVGIQIDIHTNGN